MRVLSLFDGIACGYEALQRAGIKVDAYYSSEIDKYAIQIAQKNHPDIIQLGDVNDWESWNLEGIDLIIGGSPCQGFSMAGKMLNFSDPRSALFFKFVDILKHYKPKYFLLENVKMKKEFQEVITGYMGVQPIEINSALLSAQNRKRLYRTNIPNVSIPEDKGILLKDILETDVDEKYDLTEKQKGLIEFGIQTSGGNIKRIGGAYGQVTRWGVYDTEGQAPTITASMGMGGGHIPMIVRGRPKMPYEPGHRELEYKQYLDKCPTLTENCASGDQKNTVIQPLVSMSDGELRIRKLTPIECERLQTLPDNYTEGISDTQRYKALGNGWTVDVIAHIFSFIK